MDVIDFSPSASDRATLASHGGESDGENYETANRLKTVLRPVEPSSFFREELRLRLNRAARRERSQVQVASSGEISREVLVGAAVLSAAGALVYLWRSRNLQEAPRSSVLVK